MTERPSTLSVPIVAVSIGVVLVLGFGAGRLLLGEEPHAAERAADGGDAAGGVSTERYKIPVTDTQPSRGPADALVTVVEFCDLRGPACRASDAALHAVLREHEGRVRWVHRAFVDPARPEQSHRMHAFGRAAFQYADRFWELREQFLAIPADVEITEQDYARIAHRAGLDYASLRKAVDNGQLDGAISFDAAFAIKFGVSDGSGLFVNGRKLVPRAGEDVKALLKSIVEAELDAAEQMVERGVAPEALYAEITKDGRWGVSEQDELARRAKLAERR